MERVLGIGGVFFRSSDPQALAKWYSDQLGIDPAPSVMTMRPWTSDKGVAVFAPFARDTNYFPSDKSFMLN